MLVVVDALAKIRCGSRLGFADRKQWASTPA
jgi:hypothetical protein